MAWLGLGQMTLADRVPWREKQLPKRHRIASVSPPTPVEHWSVHLSVMSTKESVQNMRFVVFRAFTY